MNAKTTLKVGSLVGGLAAAFAVDRWPSHAKAFQISFFSLIVLGSVFVFLWTQREKKRIWLAVCVAFTIHPAALFVLQRYLPFGSAIAIAPFAFVEAIMLFAVSLKVLEDQRGTSGI